jgi:hypothetical protein
MGQAFVVRVRHLHRAIIHAAATSRTHFLIDVTGPLEHVYGKVPSLAFDGFHLGVAEDLYVAVSSKLDQFGRQNSHSAVKGGEGLVQLGHRPADGRRILNQIDEIAAFRKIQRSLDSGNPPTYDHDCPYVFAL